MTFDVEKNYKIKAILLNDTTRAKGHIGCYLVMQNINNACKKHGIQIIKSYQNTNAQSDPNFIKNCQAADVILVNGEGTMHHDAKSALEIVKSCLVAKNIRNIPIILFNTVWQDNFILNNFLDVFSAIYVRESLSQKEVERAGYPAIVVPDMSFYSEEKLNSSDVKKKFLIVDSVQRRKTFSLLVFALKNFTLLRYMGEYLGLPKRRVTSFFTETHLVPAKQLAFSAFNSVEFVLTGRFHAMCLALKYGIPFSVLSSNTHKVEGVIKDIGVLENNYVVDVVELQQLNICEKISKQKEDVQKVKEYVTTAPLKIDKMFEDIVALQYESLKNQDIHYRDTLDLISGRKAIKFNKDVILKSDALVAQDSLDHINPKGTIQDNTRHFPFYNKCLELYGRDMSYLDLGCSGGGMVFEFALNGHLSIGLEGSDLSKKSGRANWRTIPENLFTCDITEPYELYNTADKKRQQFDVISIWEVLEHISETKISALLENVKKHLKTEGVFVGSISKNSKDELHVTIKDNAWWKELFLRHGFVLNDDYTDVLEAGHFCRGIKAGPFDSYDYKNNPDEGIHFLARFEKH